MYFNLMGKIDKVYFKAQELARDFSRIKKKQKKIVSKQA